ncbi:LysR family transcriptional regulator [Rubellimicrobium thermophilum]|nr:LysR family transcriptional regulator [Rubellimicrobium thermophilum]
MAGSELDLREVRAVAEVARARSFKAAAEAMHASQPTLSRLVASAEAKLGVTLFARGWEGADTTQEGDVVARSCGAILAAVDAAEQALPFGGGPRPRLRAGLTSDHLRAIDALIREGSVTLAARRLGRSQPEVSRTLSDFSRRFGLVLFQRAPSGMVALEPARTLARLHGTITFLLAQLPQHLARLEGQVVGRVAVGMLPFSGQDLIMKAFAEMTNRHPNVRLALLPGSYNSLVEALRRREIDRIVGILRQEACPTGLLETRLYDERFAVVARRDHPLQTRAADPRALAATNWIVAPHGTPIRSHFERVFLDLNLTPPTQTCELLTFGSAEQMLVDSHSVAMLTYSDRRLRLLRPELGEVPVPFPRRRAPIGVTRLASAEPDAATAAFDGILAEIVVRFEPGA